MALSTTGYQTISPQPGTSNASGSYIPCTTPYTVYSGVTQYTNGIDFLAFYAGATWGVFTAPNAGTTPSYSAPGTGTSFPLTGWSTVSGFAPAPTFGTIGGAVVSSIQPRVVIF